MVASRWWPVDGAWGLWDDVRPAEGRVRAEDCAALLCCSFLILFCSWLDVAGIIFDHMVTLCVFACLDAGHIVVYII